MDAKISAFQQEAEVTHLSSANAERAAQLSKEIGIRAGVPRTREACYPAGPTRGIKDPLRQRYQAAVVQIGAVKKEMENARASELEYVAIVATELDSAKEVLQKVAEEESSLKSLEEFLKLELEAVQKEHTELKEKDADVESLAGKLHIQLQNCKAELESAMAAEEKSSTASDELAATLQQLSAESEAALQEAETMKIKTKELRTETEAARATLAEDEKKLQVALTNAEESKAAEARALDYAEESKAAEARALDLIKELSEKASASRASTSEHGAKITLLTDEYNSLSRKVEESEELTEMKVAAAMAQVEAVRSSENETINKLEDARKEMEDMAPFRKLKLVNAGRLKEI